MSSGLFGLSVVLGVDLLSPKKLLRSRSKWPFKCCLKWSIQVVLESFSSQINMIQELIFYLALTRHIKIAINTASPFNKSFTKLKLIFRPPHGNSSSSRVIENLHNFLLTKLKKSKSTVTKTCC